jgi:hypothetical protein
LDLEQQLFSFRPNFETRNYVELAEALVPYTVVVEGVGKYHQHLHYREGLAKRLHPRGMAE